MNEMERHGYTKEMKLGRGTYGTVYSGVRNADGLPVALKVLHYLNTREKDGIEVTAVRELAALENLHHENIVCMLDQFFYKNELCLVLEKMTESLQDLIDDKVYLDDKAIRTYIKMALKGLKYLHEVSSFLFICLSPFIGSFL